LSIEKKKTNVGKLEQFERWPEKRIGVFL